jgi:hypothetical protein
VRILGCDFDGTLTRDGKKIMRLSEMKWRRISVHEMVLEWLRADRDTNVAPLLTAVPEMVKLLDEPNLSDNVENLERLRVLYMSGRWIFLFEIPPDTEWYEVEHITDEVLNELYTVNYADWNHADGTNELAKVAEWRKLIVTSEPSTWKSLILWGHSKDGPFTIIDGNHRLTAYFASGRSGLKVRAVVGLSPMGCLWQRSDGCMPLIQDIIEQHVLSRIAKLASSNQT